MLRVSLSRRPRERGGPASLLFAGLKMTTDGSRGKPGTFFALVRELLSLAHCAASGANGEAGPKGRTRTTAELPRWCAGYFLWRKESNQRKHSSPIQTCHLRRSRDFSMRHPCLIEKRRTSCAPPFGSSYKSGCAFRWVLMGRWTMGSTIHSTLPASLSLNAICNWSLKLFGTPCAIIRVSSNQCLIACKAVSGVINNIVNTTDFGVYFPLSEC